VKQLLGIAFSFVLAAACRHGGDTVVVPASATLQDTAIVHVLSNERCIMESACGHVGDGMRYSTARACLDSTDLEMRSSGALGMCSWGVHTEQLKQCVAAIRARSCRMPLNTLQCMPMDVRSCAAMWTTQIMWYSATRWHCATWRFGGEHSHSLITTNRRTASFVRLCRCISWATHGKFPCCNGNYPCRDEPRALAALA
jgi:hypothetical protein